MRRSTHRQDAANGLPSASGQIVLQLDPVALELRQQESREKMCRRRVWFSMSHVGLQRSAAEDARLASIL